jgi:hypothetical protein
MIYARCGNCTTVVPLWCSGQFMPHMPVAPVVTPHGAYCSMCGVLPPVFTCGYCWCRQFLMIQGAQLPAMQVGPGQSVAAAIEAPAGASENMLKKPFATFLENVASGVGTALGQRFGESF